MPDELDRIAAVEAFKELGEGVGTSFETPPIPRYKHPITSPDLPHPYFLFPP